MKKTLLFILIAIGSIGAKAQVIDGEYIISLTPIYFSSDTIPNYIPDSASSPLWQIGKIHKPFFSADTNVVSIMTDTVNHYRVSANNWFTLKIPNQFNLIINFWHKYQTDAGHDGGIVEFSLDTGATWQNMKGPCNTDSTGFWSGMGVKTSNFYTFKDTLSTGEPAFSGTCDTERHSRFQFLGPVPVKSTSGPICNLSDWTHPLVYIRFRFVSDTTADTLAGWIIDSVKIEIDKYWNGIDHISKNHTLPVTPNPAFDGNFIFPGLENEENYTIEVFNTIGTLVMKAPYSTSLRLGSYAKGLYFYKVTDGTEYYSGRLQYE